jgi:hypothetical protein
MVSMYSLPRARGRIAGECAGASGSLKKKQQDEVRGAAVRFGGPGQTGK